MVKNTIMLKQWFASKCSYTFFLRNYYLKSSARQSSCILRLKYHDSFDIYNTFLLSIIVNLLFKNLEAIDNSGGFDFLKLLIRNRNNNIVIN